MPRWQLKDDLREFIWHTYALYMYGGEMSELSQFTGFCLSCMITFALVKIGSSNTFYWISTGLCWRKFFHMEKKVAKCHFGALLQHNKYASSIHPTHPAKVRSAVETQTRSRGTAPKSSVPNRTAQWKRGFRNHNSANTSSNNAAF